MTIAQILFFLPTYPDTPVIQQIDSVGTLARAMDARVTAIIPQLSSDKATWPPIIGTFPLDFPQLLSDAVHDSERNAQQLADLVTRSFADLRVPLDIRRCLTMLYGSAQSVVDLARLHDLTVLPLPQSESFDRHYLEKVIFDSGHPTLLLSSEKGHRPLKSLETVMVAWDYSREAARAISDALPILKKAKSVHVVSVLGEKDIRTSCTPGDLKKYLGAHGVKYVLENVVLKDGMIDTCLAAHAAEKKADMLVMGAYGHTRLHEFLLGGATRGMIAKMPLPIFLSH